MKRWSLNRLLILSEKPVKNKENLLNDNSEMPNHHLAITQN